MATLWRLYLSATLQLHPDEAYYWLWSRHLDLGYFDHPPMVAYFIRLSTLVSQSELWVRLSGALVMLLLSGLMWQLALQLFRSVPVAAGSVMLFNLYPLTLLGMLVITPDVPVLLFWGLGVYLFWHTMRTRQAWLWYPLGLCFGLALWSKYTALLLPVCLLLYLLLSEDRWWLKTRHPYLAALLGLACFGPVVLWNSRNGWVSFAFQLNNGLGGARLQPAGVAAYTAGQLLLVGPLVWLAGMAASLRTLRQRERETLLLVCTAVPVILFFGLSSLRKVAGANWPAFAYFSFSILVAHYCLRTSAGWRRGLWVACAALSLALALVATLQARLGLLALERYAPQLAAADATNGFHGWRELGAALKRYADRSVAIAPSHQLGAEIIYYTDGQLPSAMARGTRPSQFDLLQAPDPAQTKNRIYVWTDADAPGTEAGRLQLLPALQTYRDGHALRGYTMAWQRALRAPDAADLTALGPVCEFAKQAAMDVCATDLVIASVHPKVWRHKAYSPTRLAPRPSARPP